ncbi:proteasome-activating nucleotidase [Candidatus Woesearchaeota archaeon]|nr:proteasome-activating nucleotidase [Candidatus Woesearchaeota archaeon]
MEAKSNTKDPLESVMFSYTINTSRLESENKLLRETVSQLQNEIEKLKLPALMVCDIADMIEDKAIIKTPNGNKFYVNIMSDCKNIKTGDTVLVEQKNLTVIRKINSNRRFNVEKFVIMEKPQIVWSDLGGLDSQIQEIKEVVELPLKNPELFKKIGITPPKGILLYGPPGTGKTLLAKAVANSTNSTFIEIVGSELVQKFIGEGAKLIKEIFQLARDKAPSIVFIDEIDALASKRIELGTSGEREVQRTFMQLLAELDGFKNLGNVKIVGCTNRKDILDPALIRPGRFDRLIEVSLPNKEGLKKIFEIHTKPMNLDKAINIEKIIKKMENFSGAEVRAVCTEAGYFAIRKNREKITGKDLLDAVEKVKQKEQEDKTYIEMFG